MPIRIINLNTEGRLSPTLFHPINPERYELSTHTYTVNCMNCIEHAELSFYHASLSPGLECFAVVRRSINMCLVTRNMLSLWVDARRRKKVPDRNGWKSHFSRFIEADDSIEQVFTTNSFRIFS
ncbi:hypothetical protein ALC53_02919 [Atta colombica]|uniref:Uncharacterized protein n=1 Tax=Atta colombica TaxID=520822 RepID=A0A195BR49_9HYME|nr:hypothetical protein ALC53_02919 [Atta colombica]